MNNNNEQEKALVKFEDNIFNKIKSFFRRLFNKNKIENASLQGNQSYEPSNNIQKQKFNEYIRKTDDEETKLLKLQKKYRAGEIKEEDLSTEEISALCDLYDKQIEDLRKSNNIRKQKILEYRRKMQVNN